MATRELRHTLSQLFYLAAHGKITLDECVQREMEVEALERQINEKIEELKQIVAVALEPREA